MKTVVVIPIAQTPTQEFLRQLPKDTPIIVVDGSGGRLKLNKKSFDIYDFKRQERVLGKLYEDFRIFHGASACRNFGHYLAIKQGYDVVIALDYDCHTPTDFITHHLNALKLVKATVLTSDNGWVNPIDATGWYSRGYPYEKRFPAKTTNKVKKVTVKFNMGLWNHVIDINGIDKVLKKPPQKIKLARPYTVAGSMLPISGMNNAIAAEVIPAYLLLPNVPVQNWELSRHDDIWGGYIAKRLMDKKGDALAFGRPAIFHSRESSQPGVLHHEHYIHLLSESYYLLVDKAIDQIGKSSYQKMFAQFVSLFEKELKKEKSNLPPHYYDVFGYLIRGMQWWTRVFQTL